MRLPLALFARGPCALVAACNGSTAASPAGDGGAPLSDSGIAETSSSQGGPDGATPDGCASAGFDASAYALDAAAGSVLIGTPCLPSVESSSTFDGFGNDEINLAPSQVSGAPACIAYYFRGLVTCPYGQSATGQAPACASACTTAGGEPVVGAVEPQCADRPASAVVIWSCRCANEEGLSNDGDTYCTCPSGMSCTQAISSIGASEDDFAGGYCLPPGIVRDGGSTCSVSCNPSTAPCP